MAGALRTDVALAARLRRPGPRALERPRRTVPAAERRRQPSGLSTIYVGAILPSLTQADTHTMANAARRVHAEEPPAARVFVFINRGICAPVFPSSLRRYSRGREASADLQRQE